MSTAFRTRKSQRFYSKYTATLDGSSCTFCEFTSKSHQVLKSYKYFWIVKNIFGYDMWDSSGVSEHLMIVPKRHLHSISELNESEQKEFVKILADYEYTGFSIYARSHSNSRKSVAHQHTHLIKTDNRVKKLVFFIKKPHFLLLK